jgi:hypothetical protein
VIVAWRSLTLARFCRVAEPKQPPMLCCMEAPVLSILEVYLRRHIAASKLFQRTRSWAASNLPSLTKVQRAPPNDPVQQHSPQILSPHPAPPANH